jgi:hypothetical protein
MIYTKLFEDILERPTIYVGNFNIRHIEWFMLGYIHANEESLDRDLGDLYFGFQNWIADLYGVSRTLHWANIITLYSSGEQSAFDITVTSWNEYKTDKKKVEPPKLVQPS